MNLLSLVTDNITELLVKIVEFTQLRQKVLTQNIKNMHAPGFVPVDLAVDEFSQMMNTAIEEHVRNRRLVLCDSDNIKLGMAGALETRPVPDESAREFLEAGPDSFLEFQVNKLRENSINQRLAAALLRQRKEAASSLHRTT
ncbi:MAG: hypothetical protein JSU94_11330 [Phycisphaerales bacterium]|nr:MAG: hypothetical protein JSU94_11330 [Phycisphaerales bacterium]